MNRKESPKAVRTPEFESRLLLEKAGFRLR